MAHQLTQRDMNIPNCRKYALNGMKSCISLLAAFMTMSVALMACDGEQSEKIEGTLPTPIAVTAPARSAVSVETRPVTDALGQTAENKGTRQPDTLDESPDVVESYPPFNPLDDCPQPEDSSGPNQAGAQANSNEALENTPGAAVVSINEYPPDGVERTHIANGVVLRESGQVAAVIDFSAYPRCLEVVLQDGTALPARMLAVHRRSGTTILEVTSAGLPHGATISQSPIYTETPVHMYSIRRSPSHRE